MVEPRTVLVVDGDPDVLLLCRVTLEAEGHRVLVAGDRAATLTQLADGSPDLVIVDVTLPHDDGWAVLDAVRTGHAGEVPVVLVGVAAQDGDRLRGLAEPPAEYVTEPLDPLSLSRLVADVLDPAATGSSERRRTVLDQLGPLIGPDRAGGTSPSG